MESYDLYLLSVMESKGIVMNENKTSASDAKEALNLLDNTQQALLNDSTPSVWIRLVMSISFAAIFFGYGMTEHENMWALAMWIGAIMFGLTTALYIYTYRLQGIRIGFLPKSSQSEKLNVIAAFVFVILAFGGRYLRTEYGIEWSPHVCSFLAAVTFFWLQHKYPTGEIEVKEHTDGNT